MSEMLNLDQFAPVKKSVTILGKKYDVLDMTVDVFIKVVTASKNIKDDASEVEHLKASLEMIKFYIPTIEEEVLQTLSFIQVEALSQFVRGEAVRVLEEGKQAIEEGADASGAEAKKE